MRLAGVAEGLHAYRRSVTRDVEELLIRETPHSDRERS
jgi:hypothetical protein